MTAGGRPIMAGAEPFAHPGHGDVGALLVHGFTGTPYEMRPVGEHLAQRGIGSEAVLLRGHGTHPDDMLAARHTDWIADVEAGLDRLSSTYRRVFLVGLSMGGTLVLNVAARHSTDPRIAGVVSIAAPVRLEDWRLRIVRWGCRVVPWQVWGRPDIKDRRAWDRHVGYKRFRTRTVLELLALMNETLVLLPSVTQPLLLLHARQDHVVPPNNAPLIYGLVGSQDKQLVWLDNSYHVVTVDFAAPVLNEAIARFVEEWAVLEAREQAGAAREGW
ncbi:MAG: alpha/beta fold hydrolase [Chloroflexota bacterium]|nr:alpha/beta fold hydrolase [Chloroflexota bacterium]